MPNLDQAPNLMTRKVDKSSIVGMELGWVFFFWVGGGGGVECHYLLGGTNYLWDDVMANE